MVDKEWRNYEDVARFLLNEIASKFGLVRVEGKQIVPGHHSKTNWEIDGKGMRSDGATFVILECKRYTPSGRKKSEPSKLKQQQIAGIAYQIIDTGADGALVVSPAGFQEGAKKVAKANKIVEIRLTPESTTSDYLLQFLSEIHAGDTVPSATDAFGMVLQDTRTGRILETFGNPSLVSRSECVFRPS